MIMEGGHRINFRTRNSFTSYRIIETFFCSLVRDQRAQKELSSKLSAVFLLVLYNVNIQLSVAYDLISVNMSYRYSHGAYTYNTWNTSYNIATLYSIYTDHTVICLKGQSSINPTSVTGLNHFCIWLQIHKEMFKYM
jgi:hypothetical protein